MGQTCCNAVEWESIPQYPQMIAMEGKLGRSFPDPLREVSFLPGSIFLCR
jgi:hypothetical protein